MSVIIPRLNLWRIKEADLAAYAENKVKNLTDNPNYPLPFPQLDETAALIAPYLNAVTNTEDGNRTNTETKRDLLKRLRDALTYLAWNCSYRSQKNVTMFLESGFTFKRKGSPIGILDAPENMRSFEGIAKNSILLKWKSMPKADDFVVQVSEIGEAEDSFKDIGFPTSSRFLVTDLKRGKEYWFRVAAITPSGISPWSQIIARIVV